MLFKPRAVVLIRVGDEEGIDVEPPVAVPRQPIPQGGRHIRRIFIRIIRSGADIDIDKDFRPLSSSTSVMSPLPTGKNCDLRHHDHPLLCLGGWRYSQRPECPTQMGFPPGAAGNLAGGQIHNIS